MRLHENKWGATEASFITEAMWRACVDPGVSQLLPAGDGKRTAELFVGVDVGVRHDSSAVVAVRRQNDDKLVLARHHIWRPGPSGDVQIKDIEALANMPSKEEIFSKLLYLINAPAQRLVTAMNGVGRNLAVVIDQGVKENKFQQ